MDPEKAALKVSRMWAKIARSLEAHAVELAAAGESARAVRTAEMADACYWQATGEMSSTSVEAITGTKQ